MLGYPVISFTQNVHQGSKRALLGDNPDPKLVENLSNELQVTAQTPPTFLFHTTNDQTVPVENSVMFYLALHKAGVPAEMHIYENGPHGVGLAPTDEALSSWPARLADWMRGRGSAEIADACAGEVAPFLGPLFSFDAVLIAAARPCSITTVFP